MGDYVRQLQLPGDSSDLSRRAPLALRLHLDVPLLLLLVVLTLFGLVVLYSASGQKMAAVV
ncbi:MAG TPA: rod shape-determining protein RodA, partial [Haliea salexigens]|nr:rod shape-determining protein RodA [Haliea salexigens]